MADEFDPGSKTLELMSWVILFSFVSIIMIFVALLIVGGINNYVLGNLLDVTSSYAANNLIPSNFVALSVDIADNYIQVINYLDYMWLASFITMVATTFIFSYVTKRENYFSLLSMTVLGIIVLMYLNDFVIQITRWFNTEILLKVFPTITDQLTFFTWYLNNIGIINLIIICVCIILNFVDLDLSGFNAEKQSETLQEI